MNPNISQETYFYLDSTLNTLRDEITYVKDCDTRLALMEHRDAMKRIIDGFLAKPVNPTIPPPPRREHIEPPLKSLYELPTKSTRVESYDDFWNEPLYPPNPARRWIDSILRRKNEDR